MSSTIIISAPLTGIKICLDPGHGGNAGQTYNGNPGDPGAIGLNGLREADVNLQVATELKSLLAGAGADVYMTRTDNVFITLGGRTTYANNAKVDRFVSIHFNASSSRSANYSGAHVYTSASQNSIDLASKTIIEIEKALKLPLVSTNCGVRGVHKDDFYVVRNTNMPAELTESSFISNIDEEARLRNPDYVKSIARAHYLGVLAHFNKSVPDDIQPPVIAHTKVNDVFDNEDINVVATVTDNKGIKNVYLYYRNINELNFAVIEMSKIADNQYSAVIPAAYTKVGKLEYYIKAIDSSATANSAILPASAPASNFIININEVPSTGKLVGIIFDLETDKRLEGVKCTLTPGNISFFTSSTGLYTFDKLKAGDYTVTAEYQGYKTASSSKTVIADQTVWNSIKIQKEQNRFKDKVIISEIMWAGYEYVELYNRTDEIIDISNWQLVNSSNKIIKINDNAKIYPKSYYLIAKKGALTDITPNEIKSISLLNTIDTLKLYSGNISEDNLVDAVVFTNKWPAGNSKDKGHSMAVKDLTKSNDTADNWFTSDQFFGGRYGTPGFDNNAVKTAATSGTTRSASSTSGTSGYKNTSAIMVITGPTIINIGSTYKYKAEVISKTGKVLKTFEFDHKFDSTDDLQIVKTTTITENGQTEQVTGILSVSVRDYGKLEAYFNNPATGDKILENKLVELIASAKSSIDVAIYSLKSWNVVNALVNAAKIIGAQNIRIVTEGEVYNDKSSKEYYSKLKEAGIKIVLDSSKASETTLMHNKFVVIDDKKVLTGSYNFNYSSAMNDNNNIVIIESVKVAEQFKKEFNEMFVSKKFGVEKTDNTLHSFAISSNSSSNLININKASIEELTTLPSIGTTTAKNIVDYRNANGSFIKIDDIKNVKGIGSTTFDKIKNLITVNDGNEKDGSTEIEIYFSPSDNCLYNLRKELNKAKSEIVFCVFAFTDQNIASDLISAKNRGVSIAGVFDSIQTENSYSKFETLKNAGLNVIKSVNSKGIMHNKFAVIDKSVVITGSFNWTNTANSSNDENLIIIHSPELAQKYYAEYQKIVAASKININIASKNDLMKLPGIGETTAQKIIDYRTKNGAFKSIDDIKNVTGIGTTTYNNIKNLITV